MNEIQIHNRQTVAEIRASINLIQEVMASCMKKDVHYGTIPGTNKPTLYKAGSEKILSTFRIAVELDVEDLSTNDSFRYRVKARGILPSGEIVGCGIGECSTDEEKYRWRGAVSDKEFDATPEDRKRIKYTKIYKASDTGEIRQIRTNPADLANTVLKMAKKRAQIDLTLTATAASDVFEQDIEDLPAEYVDGMREGQSTGGKPEVKAPQSKTATADDGKKATESQVKLLEVKLKKANVDREAFKSHFNIVHLADLPMSKVNDAIKAIDAGEIKAKDNTPVICADCGQPFDSAGKCACEERTPGQEG